MITKEQESLWSVHPLLIMLPLVLFALSVTFDLVAMLSSEFAWNDLGGANLASGLASALVAYVSLARRHRRIEPGSRRRRRSLVLLELSGVALLFFAAALAVRITHTPGPTPPLAVLLSLVALGLATIAGWLSEGWLT